MKPISGRWRARFAILGAASVALGVGIGAPAWAGTLTVSPTSYSFGNVRVGTSAQATIVVTNGGGGGPHTLTSASLNNTDYTVTPCSPWPVDLAPGDQCQITVTFQPSARGTDNATLTIDTSDVGTKLVAFAGTGVSPTADVSPTNLAFGSASVGHRTSAQTATLTNNGNTGLAVSSFSVTGDFAGEGGCTDFTIAPGSSCSISVTFDPVTMGARTGVLTFVTELGNRTVSLAGTGLSGTADVTPTNLDFSTVAVGEQSQLTVTLANHGNAGLAVGTVDVTNGFAVDGGCDGLTIAPNASCAVGVTFAPTARGARTGVVTIHTEVGDRTVTVAGTGIGPTAELSVSSLDFGSVEVGQASGSQSVALTNNGDGALTVSSVTPASMFASEDDCTDGPIAPQASCSIQVSFAPTASGAATGTITVSTNAGDQVVTLSGTGVDPPAPPTTQDLTPPSATLVGPPPGFTLSATAVLNIAGSDPESGVSELQVRRRTASATHGFGDWEVPANLSAVAAGAVSVSLGEGMTTCFAVRARNGSGVYGEWTAARCVTRPMDDRALVASHGWRRQPGGGFLNGSVSTTRKRGALLRLPAASVSGLAVVASRCPSCGTIGVYVGTTLVARVNLKGRRADSALIVLPTALSGMPPADVRIKVLSRGRLVRIDGLGVRSDP